MLNNKINSKIAAEKDSPNSIPPEFQDDFSDNAYVPTKEEIQKLVPKGRNEILLKYMSQNGANKTSETKNSPNSIPPEFQDDFSDNAYVPTKEEIQKLVPKGRNEILLKYMSQNGANKTSETKNSPNSIPPEFQDDFSDNAYVPTKEEIQKLVPKGRNEILLKYMSQNGSSPDIPPFSEETLGTIKGAEPTKPNPHYRGEAANADEMNAIPDPIGGDFCGRTDTSSEWKYDWIEGRNIWYDTNFPIGTIPHTIPNTGKIVAEGEGIGSAAGLSSGTFVLKKETIYFTLTDFNSFVLPRIYDFFDLHGISSAPDVIVYTVNIKTPLSTSSGVVSFLDNNTRRFHLSESRKSIKMYIYTSSFSRSEIRTLRFYFNDLNILTLKYIDYMKASGSSDYLSLITNNGITSFNSSGAIDLKLDGYYYEEI